MKDILDIPDATVEAILKRHIILEEFDMYIGRTRTKIEARAILIELKQAAEMQPKKKEKWRA